METLEKKGTITKTSGSQTEELTVDTQFYVYLNGNTLVDGYKVNEIVYTQKDTYTNICDIKGLYELGWETVRTSLSMRETSEESFSHFSR